MWGEPAVRRFRLYGSLEGTWPEFFFYARGVFVCLYFLFIQVPEFFPPVPQVYIHTDISDMWVNLCRKVNIHVVIVLHTVLPWRSPTWGQEGGEIIEDLSVPLPSCETHHRAHVEGEGPQLLPGAQAVHLQHVLHVVEEADEQVAGVRAGGKHWKKKKRQPGRWYPTLIVLLVAAGRRAASHRWRPCRAEGWAPSSCSEPARRSRCWWGGSAGRPGWSWTWTTCPHWSRTRTRRRNCRWASPTARALKTRIDLEEGSIDFSLKTGADAFTTKLTTTITS